MISVHLSTVWVLLVEEHLSFHLNSRAYLLWSGLAAIYTILHPTNSSKPDYVTADEDNGVEWERTREDFQMLMAD